MTERFSYHYSVLQDLNNIAGSVLYQLIVGGVGWRDVGLITTYDEFMK